MGIILEEGVPVLPRSFSHLLRIFLDGPLVYFDAELQKFALNLLNSPEPVF
jgi:hypothetical protein